MDPYVERLLKEIQEKTADLKGRVIQTVYFGGGTPSLLHPSAVQRILKALLDIGGAKDVEEITMEANPGTLTKEKVTGYLMAGVNRFSLGLQSAIDEELKTIGRIHSYQDFLESVQLLRREGCNNLSVDLMTGLPGQTMASFRQGLEKVLAMRPEHLSCYGLTVEEETPLYAMVASNQVILNDDLEREMYEVLLKEAEKHGYEHYEISNFALPGYHSRHNNRYWDMGDYVGLGLGASSFLEGRRFRNTRDFSVYVEEKSLQEEERVELDAKAWKEEWMFLGLRKMSGVNRRIYQQIFGSSMEAEFGEIIASLVKKGLLYSDEEGIRLTKNGLTFANEVFRGFLLD